MPILKKTFFISLLIFFATLLFWGVYNLAFKKDTPDKTTPKSIIPEISLPKVEPEIAAVSDEAVLPPALTPDGDYIKYYSQKSGKVYQISLDGKEKTIISDQELSGINDTLWSPDKTKVITKFVKSINEVQFYYYDYTTRKGVGIKKNIDDVIWDYAGNKILYKYYSPDTKERSLNIADPDGTNWKKLADLTYRYVSIASVPKSGLVSFWNKPDSFMETTLETVSAIGGEKKTIYTGKFGADYLWSPDGNYLLVSHVSERSGENMQLGVMNYNGGEYKNLNAPTFVSKCAWAKNSQTVYCALPGSMPDAAILPNEYMEKKFFTADTFWKIDTQNGKMDRIVEPEKITGRFDATGLFLNSDESMLFFVNRTDGKLYRINL